MCVCSYSRAPRHFLDLLPYGHCVVRTLKYSKASAKLPFTLKKAIGGLAFALVSCVEAFKGGGPQSYVENYAALEQVQPSLQATAVETALTASSAPPVTAATPAPPAKATPPAKLAPPAKPAPATVLAFSAAPTPTMEVCLKKKTGPLGVTLAGNDDDGYPMLYKVAADSAANGAVKPGDVLLSVNGTVVTGGRKQGTELLKAAAGEVKLIVRRGTHEICLKKPKATSIFGVTLKGEGFPRIVAVSANGIANGAVQPGDILLSVNETVVDGGYNQGSAELKAAVGEVKLSVQRGIAQHESE